MGASVGAADAGDGGAAGHDEQVVPALAVSPLRLGQHEVGKVKSAKNVKFTVFDLKMEYYLPQLTDPVIQFVNCQSTRAHSEISDNH